MGKRIVVFEVDENVVNPKGSKGNKGFENELGWLRDSGIVAKRILDEDDTEFTNALILEKLKTMTLSQLMVNIDHDIKEEGLDIDMTIEDYLKELVAEVG